MPLTKCPECGRYVSDEAGKCPGCGAPIRKPVGVAAAVKRDRPGRLRTLFVVVPVLALFLVLGFGYAQCAHRGAIARENETEKARRRNAVSPQQYGAVKTALEESSPRIKVNRQDPNHTHIMLITVKGGTFSVLEARRLAEQAHEDLGAESIVIIYDETDKQLAFASKQGIK